jgi:crotonobetainyl-CoA:carnitine CoA-transferase CaiB-like acyl-CoA transferase
LSVGLRHSAALIERGKTGRGQKVEGALPRTAIAFTNATLIEQALTGPGFCRGGVSMSNAGDFFTGPQDEARPACAGSAFRAGR